MALITKLVSQKQKRRVAWSLDSVAWYDLLPQTDIDFDYIIDGVINAFKSAFDRSVNVERQLNIEFSLGNYVKCENPSLVSDLGTVCNYYGPSWALILDTSMFSSPGLMAWARRACVRQ